MIFLLVRALALACRGHHELVLENLEVVRAGFAFHEHDDSGRMVARRLVLCSSAARELLFGGERMVILETESYHATGVRVASLPITLDKLL